MKIGFGKTTYTPRGKKINLFGQMHLRIAEEIKDDLWAEAMIIRSDKARTVWVSVDALGLTEQTSKEAYEKVHQCIPDLKEEEFVISATHIHTGPSFARYNELLGTDEEIEGTFTSTECREMLTDAIKKAVIQAESRLEEARLELGVSRIQTGVCRRVVLKDGTANIYGKISSPDFLKMEGRDGGPMQLIYAYNSQNKLKGILANVPCTAQCDEQACYVTSDYWGFTRNKIQAALGDEVVLLPLLRSAGDLSPHHIIDRFPSIPAPHGEGGRKNARILGEEIADAICKEMKNTTRTYSGDIYHAQGMKELSLPRHEVSKEEYAWSKEYLEKRTQGIEVAGENSPHSTGNKRFDFLNSHGRIKEYENTEQDVKTKIYATALGDAVLISNPFELYIEYADRIRAALPERVVYDVELSYDRLGYLPTERAAAGGGYSTFTFNGACPPKAGDILVEESIKLIEEIFSK